MEIEEIAIGILNDIEGILDNSLPIGEMEYLPETKKIAIWFVDRVMYNFCNDAMSYNLYSKIKKYIQSLK